MSQIIFLMMMMSVDAQSANGGANQLLGHLEAVKHCTSAHLPCHQNIADKVLLPDFSSSSRTKHQRIACYGSSCMWKKKKT